MIAGKEKAAGDCRTPRRYRPGQAVSDSARFWRVLSYSVNDFFKVRQSSAAFLSDYR